MNVALFSDTFPPAVNGVANAVYESARSLVRRGHKVCVVTVSHEKRKKVQELSEGDFRVLILPSVNMPVYPDVQFGLPLGLSFEKMLQFDPDIIHAHTPFSVGMEALLASVGLGAPLIGTHHTFFDHYLKHMHLDYRWSRKATWKMTVGYYNRCDLVTSPTQSLADGLTVHGLHRPVKILPNGIDVELFAPGTEQYRASAREKLGIPEDATLALYVGRVSYEKSIDDAMRSVALAAQKVDKLHFLVVGDGPEKKSLQVLAQELNIADRVHFTGYLFGKDLVQSFHAADFFLSASKTENMPLSFLEALACGLPIVSVESLGLPEIVPPDCGVLVPPGDISTLSHEIVELCNDETRRASMGQKAREHAMDFSTDAITERLEDVYKQTIG